MSAFPETLELHCGPVTAVDLALFAAASGDHNPLHLDVEAARAAGFDRPLVHGMLTMAYAARLFTKTLGAGSVRHLHTRFTGAARLGDTVVLSATLTGTEGELGLYDLDARTSAGVELVSGKARVASGPTR
ncbi:MaoC family dehydratase [Variovorax sp. GT1P44]|uniref:MaoC family dehydratase n=1 Tax=Variovorax sp. GT1P44 TaxID=3443742 RepID=UPI003F47B9F3